MAEVIVLRPVLLGVTNDLRSEELTLHIFTAKDEPPSAFLVLSREQVDYLLKALPQARRARKKRLEESGHGD